MPFFLKKRPLLLFPLVLMSGCASTDCKDSPIGKGVVAPIDAVNRMVSQGQLGSSVDGEASSDPKNTQSSWQGFERSREERMDLLFAPMADGDTAWGEVHADVVVRVPTWTPKTSSAHALIPREDKPPVSSSKKAMPVSLSPLSEPSSSPSQGQGL